MLKGRNVVVIKGKDGADSKIIEYDRVYLEFGAGDELEEFTKTTEKKDLMLNGQVWKGLRPKAEVSSVDPQVLMSEAIAYFAQRYPGTPEKPKDPNWQLLEAASYGADLWERNTIQNDKRESKPIDSQAAIEKMVKTLLQFNPALGREAAVAMASQLVTASAAQTA